MARKKKKNGKKSQGNSSSRKWGMQHVFHEMETKGSFKNTAHKTGYQVATVVMGGAIATALMGKHGLWGGLIMAGVGNFFKVPVLTQVGLGAMAASTFIPWDDQSTVKDRFKNLYQKSGIPKAIDLIKNKQAQRSGNWDGERSEENTDGPDNSVSGVLGSLETLNQVEQQLVASAMDYQSRRGVSVSGLNNMETDFSRM